MINSQICAVSSIVPATGVIEHQLPAFGVTSKFMHHDGRHSSPPGVALLQCHIALEGAACGQPKVTELVDALLGSVDVVWLHIHVNNATCMQVLQCLCNLPTTPSFVLICPLIFHRVAC